MSQVLRVHEESEETAIFPEMDNRYKYVSETYLYDHQRHSGGYDEIEGILTSLGGARGNSTKVELAQKLHRQAIALDAVMDLHIDKENELLYPLYDMTFTEEEQQSMEQKIMSHMLPDFMPRVAPWMFRHQGLNDREGMLRYGMKIFPPEHLGPMLKLLSGAVTTPEWEEMRKKIPELAKLGV